MAVTGYTDHEFRRFMHDTLGEFRLTEQLNWKIHDGDYDEPLNETLLVLGLTDITTVTATADLRRLRAVGRAELWRHVMHRTAGYHQRGLNEAARSEQQIHQQAKALFEAAKSEAVALGVPDYDGVKPAAVATTIVRRGIEVD